ncbi:MULTISPECIES: magnesium transporter [unclassified Candidatus Frackibacter]|uniref:magnesium transporter n=1 Tax=unclassified Candidatus Frackibacter TaxID=2648818 RepID=UPI000884DC9B|nr:MULTISPECIES: magnesium transporter [unclassified Candidatus Frackibacter]SDC26395.1 magnesium transporter [Candidatus Frackibacter sp. WG11]SEM53419.1 magnesium transporter [Candidatus Frackibacter sp. WG12]SFL55104.1 magnesium transporter [Candidatus Frackibacter sp. WG13]
MANELFIELKKELAADNEVKFNNYLEKAHPIDLAELLADLNDEEIIKVYNLGENKKLSDIIEQADEELQIRFLKMLELNDIINILSYMSADNVTDIIGNLPFDRRKKLLQMMKAGEADSIRKLLNYDPESAGGLMTTEYIALKETISIDRALTKIKDISPKTEVIETIYVLDDKNHLVGSTSLRSILVASEDQQLKEITDYNVISVHPEVDQEEVAFLVAKYDLISIPVINQQDRLLGIITVDDIIDVIKAENTEDMFRLAGVNEEEKIDSSLIDSIRKRLPWLFVNLVTAFLAAFTVSLFEDVITQVVALAAAMPIVAGMGGNAGTQTLAIAIRGIALGKLNIKEDWKIVFKEIMVGLINGAVIGIITGVVLYFKYGNPYLGLIIFLAMIGNLVIAGLSGFLIPLVLEVLGIDPALASAIFLTTFTDVFGFFIFLGLAQTFLSFLI